MSSQECADNNFNNSHVPVKLKILAVQFVLQLWIRATTDKSKIKWIDRLIGQNKINSNKINQKGYFYVGY